MKMLVETGTKESISKMKYNIDISKNSHNKGKDVIPKLKQET